ncbi:MAG: hypothetical protein QOH93_1501 [Chloroflexia bacterium]|jgi:hypothetical protein|nr:hypothetical protein [Chloroflexia bacterium]
MSEIDSYKHECIGMVSCPASYGLGTVYFREERPQWEIPLYRIDDDAPDATSFDAKRGDFLIGGGGGESPALRISIPEAINFLTNEAWDGDSGDEICKAYWTMNQAFVFCEGYEKLGWTPVRNIEAWLTEHVVAFVIREYANVYGMVAGPNPIEADGSICRLPTAEEQAIW